MTPGMMPGVRAIDLQPGHTMSRADTGELLYTVESVATEPVFNPEVGAWLTYIRADCRHSDDSLRPHYWLPQDWVAAVL